MTTHQVYLYYPNSWLRWAGFLCSEECCAFNWFLCGKRYFDTATDHYLLELGAGTKFYEPATGATLFVPLPPKNDKERKTRILIAENEDPDREIQELVAEHQLQGYAKRVGRVTTALKCEILCSDVEFYFLPEVLEPTTQGKSCELIRYAKQNYPCIREKVSDFPDPATIDKILDEGYSCQTVSRILYAYLDA